MKKGPGLGKGRIPDQAISFTAPQNTFCPFAVSVPPLPKTRSMM